MTEASSNTWGCSLLWIWLYGLASIAWGCSLHWIGLPSPYNARGYRCGGISEAVTIVTVDQIVLSIGIEVRSK